MTGVLHLSAVELKLLLRRKITAFSVVVVPVGLAALLWFGPTPQEWSGQLSRDFLLLMMLSVYLVTLTVFTARRQSLVLKRLRTSELSDFAVLAGVLGPVVMVGLTQTLVYLGFCLAIGAPAPTAPLLAVVGVVSGLAVATAAGVATACLSRSVEATQLTSTPMLVATFGGLFLTASATSTAAAAAGLALPLVGPMDLVARGWGGGVPAGNAWWGVGSSVVWVAVSALLFRRYFRWEPRA